MEYTNGAGHCPNCNRAAGFSTELHIRIWPTKYHYRTAGEPGGNVFAKPPSAAVWVDLDVYRCSYCQKTVTVRDQWAAAPAAEREEGEDESAFLTRMIPRHVHRERVYPSTAPRELANAVPETIRSLFAEASKCEHAGARRAAGVMYRAAVEELVKDQGATGHNLHKKIEDLKTKGLDEDLVEDLHEARMTGNDSIHDGIVYSAEEVADVANLIEEATFSLYVQPAEKKAMRDARKARRDGARNAKTVPPVQR